MLNTHFLQWRSSYKNYGWLRCVQSALDLMKWVKRRRLGDGRLVWRSWYSQSFPPHRTWNLCAHSVNKPWKNLGKLSKVPSLCFLNLENKIKMYSRCQALSWHVNHLATRNELCFNCVWGRTWAVFVEENWEYYYSRQSIIQWCCHRQQEIIRVRLSPQGQGKMIADQIMSFRSVPTCWPKVTAGP